MAWFLFMDETGHDHKQMPYEVRGGFALHDEALWPLVKDAHTLELECFGARLADYKSEIKGEKLLKKERFKHAAQMEEIEAMERQQLCRALLQGGLEKRPPTRAQLTAYGQASLKMAEGIFDLLERHKARLFASAVPRGAAAPPPVLDPRMEGVLRKDHTFLLERFFYHLEKERQMGILVMDEVEKTEDRRFVAKLLDRQVGHHVAHIVGHLVGLTQPFAQGAPRFGRCAGSRGTGHRRRREQGAGLGAVVIAQRDLGLALPGLARGDAQRLADAARDQAQQARQPGAMR